MTTGEKTIFDFKKEYQEFYQPKTVPQIVAVPAANFVATRGQGDPNEEDGAYKRAVGVLYSIAYALKTSDKTDYRIDGFFNYVVPPLEGFWSFAAKKGGPAFDANGDVDLSDKGAFDRISAIRLPDFIKPQDFAWAVETTAKKKNVDCSTAEFWPFEEGLCAQVLHIGPFDEEPKTIRF